MTPQKTSRFLRSSATWIGLFVFAVLLMFTASGSAQAQRPNGAGLVVQHGDGTLIYVYVPFDEESISGEELLNRSALAVEVDVFGGLGMALCSLNNEGCPSDDCFCQSYSDPAEFWHFYTWSGTDWVENPLGVSTRSLVDGDIDGWSWNAGAHSLPPVSIDEIASINGFDRNLPEPTATEAPVPLPPSPTSVPASTSVPTVISPDPTETPQPDASISPTLAATATLTATETNSSSVSTSVENPTASPTSTSPEENNPTATTTTSTSEATATSSATATDEPGQQAAAVIVTPGATPQPLTVNDAPESSSRTTLVLFAAVFGGVAIAGVLLVVRNRRRSVA